MPYRVKTMPLDFSKIVTVEMKQAEALARTRQSFRDAIQAHVDAVARSRNYGDGNALASYATSTVAQWAAEAQAFVAWRDAIWLYAYSELAKVEAAERTIPSVDDFIAELPAIEWPQAA